MISAEVSLLYAYPHGKHAFASLLPEAWPEKLCSLIFLNASYVLCYSSPLPIHQPAVPIAIVLKIQNKTESKNNQKFTGKKILYRGRIDL